MLTNKTLTEVLTEIGSDGTVSAENDFSHEGTFCDYLDRQADFLIKAEVNCKRENIATYFGASYWEAREIMGDVVAHNRDARRMVEPSLGKFLPLLYDIEQIVAFIREYSADKGFCDESRRRLTVDVNKANAKAYVGKNGSALLYELDLRLKRKARKMGKTFRRDVEHCHESISNWNFHISFLEREGCSDSFVMYWKNPEKENKNG
jgi:hypothetical protein